MGSPSQMNITAAKQPRRARWLASRGYAHGSARSLLILFILFGAALWWLKPWELIGGGPGAPQPDAQPRTVAARGSLAEDENNNIAVFKAVSPSVVHINTLELTRNFFSLDVMQVPKGYGSGFIWDERGNVVTNFHVIQGGSGARVTLADQSTGKAALVGAFPD